MQSRAFATTWHNRLGVPRIGWRSTVKRRLAELPFVDAKEVQPLIKFLLGELPDLLGKTRDPIKHMLGEAFGWFCYAFWQCESAFPAFPENYAQYLKAALTSAKRPTPAAIALAGMVVEFNSSDGRCGFNRFELAQPEVIRESEFLVQEGRYEFYLRAKEKYDEYFSHLQESGDFRAEWQMLKQLFPSQIADKAIVHRSLLPERNWVQSTGARFSGDLLRFQALFDFFCWKYYLWGMEGDTPLLLKTSVVFTPYGTQLFIPGYLSLDPKRDLDFSKVTRLHRARGVVRQGPGFSIGRRDLAELRRKAQLADRAARGLGLKGEKRYRNICAEIGFKDTGDFRRLRKLLQKR